jgi:hypothetical protein
MCMFKYYDLSFVSTTTKVILRVENLDLSLLHITTRIKRGIYATGDRATRSLQGIVSFEKIRTSARKLGPKLIACKKFSFVSKNHIQFDFGPRHILEGR